MSVPTSFRALLPKSRCAGWVLVGLFALVMVGSPLVASADTADSEDTADTADTADSGDDGSSASGGDDTAGGSDSAFDDGYQGWGPAELAGEKGGCLFVSQSAAYLGLLLWAGTWKRRREAGRS